MLARAGAAPPAVVVVAARRAARSAGRAAPALERRVDVLELRAHRRRPRRNPYRDTPSDFPGRSGVRVQRRGLARLDVGLRARVHAGVGAARRGRGDLAGRGGLDLQDAGGARRGARWLPLAARLAARPALARGLRRLEPTARRAPRGGGPQRRLDRRAASGGPRVRRRSASVAGAAWVVRCLDQVDPARLLPAARDRGAAERAGRSGSSASRCRRPPCSRSRRGATASPGSMRSDRSPRTRRETTSYALPRATRPARRSRRAPRSRSSPRSSSSATRCSSARRGAGGLGSRSPRCCCSPARRTSRLGTSRGSFRSPRSRRTALARGLALALTAYLLPQTIPV